MMLDNQGGVLGLWSDADARPMGDAGGWQTLSVTEVQPDGGVGFNCRLPGLAVAQTNLSPHGAVVLRSGTLVVSGDLAKLATGGSAEIAAFALPGYDISSTGWAAPDANMERNGYVR